MATVAKIAINQCTEFLRVFFNYLIVDREAPPSRRIIITWRGPGLCAHRCCARGSGANGGSGAYLPVRERHEEG